jgi:hypothetical protein
MLRALAVSFLVVAGASQACSGSKKPTFLETCDKLCDREAACDLPPFTSELTTCKSACTVGSGFDTCFAADASDAWIAAVNVCLGGPCDALERCVEAMCTTTGAGGSGSTAGASGSTAGASGSAAGASGSAAGASGSGSDGASDGASGSTGASGADGGDAADASSVDAGTAAGTIVPLYTDPGDSSWTAIVAAKRAHPTVHVVAIVNPNSGPGASQDAAYTGGIGTLEAAGIQVIGYVATGYASHTVASMEAAIDTWRTFYPAIEGIFFDEQSDKAADVGYYQTLSQYAKAHGLPYTVGNPGTDTAEAYVQMGALDTMLIYESKGLPSVTSLGGWHTKYAPANFGVIPYGAAFDAAFVREARASVGYIYIQSDDLPNPWDTLPPFFGDLLAALE